MKTKTLLFLTLISIAGRLYSQGYHPIINNSAWIVGAVGDGISDVYTISQGEDQVIGAYTYSKFIDPYLNREILLREDVASKKVYRLLDNNEVLLFDFSLNLHDLITLANGETYRFYSIGVIYVVGGQRRVINLEPITGSPLLPEESWIEGVGSAEHPLLPTYEIIDFNFEYLINCSFQNGVNVFNASLAHGGVALGCQLLDVPDANHTTGKINFSPNPFGSELVISTGKSLKNSTLYLYNPLGQLVKEIPNLNGNKIILKRENLNSGIYLIQLLEDGKIAGTGKVLVTN